MKLFKFENYEHYKKEQVKANVRKLEWTWIQEDTINKIKTYKPDANKILCHGVRNAKELEFFSTRYIVSEIIGTEISHTAKQFQNVVEWDFHEIKDEWKNNFDIVYSNSWDHSYDPNKSLQTGYKNMIKTSTYSIYSRSSNNLKLYLFQYFSS